MADESSLVKLLAEKFRKLSSGQVKKAVEATPPPQQPAAAAAAGTVLPKKSYTNLLKEIPGKIAASLKLLLSKSSPASQQAQQAGAAASLEAATVATGPSRTSRVACAITGLVAQVYGKIEEALGHLPALTILKQTSARVPIWSERYGRVTPKLVQSLIDKFGPAKANEIIGKIGSKRFPRVSPFPERYTPPDLLALSSALPPNVFKNLQKYIVSITPRVSVNNSRYNSRVDSLLKKFLAAGVSRDTATHAAHVLASSGARVSWHRSAGGGGPSGPGGSGPRGARTAWSAPSIKKYLPSISIMGALRAALNMVSRSRSRAGILAGLRELEKAGVRSAWVASIRQRLLTAKTQQNIEKISDDFANAVAKQSSGDTAGADAAAASSNGGPVGRGVSVAVGGKTNQNWLKNVGNKSLDNMSLETLVGLRRKYPSKKEDIDRALGPKVESLLSRNSRYGTSGIKTILKFMKNAPNLPGKDRVYDLIEQRMQDIEYEARNNPVTAKDKLRRFKSAIGYSGGLFANRNLGRIFSNAEQEYNRKIADNRRRKMNENRNRRGLPPLPNNRRNFPPLPNNRRPLGNAGVFRPPANQPVPNLRSPPNMGPPLNLGPPLNIGETKAINNVGGPNKALNLVQNAGGPSNVLRAANQLKEAGGSPELAVAKGANAKNVKIVLQLGGANNAAKVATAVPKLRKRRRSKKTKTKGRPKVLAIKKLLRSLPKKKLLAILPKSNKAALANKNKANVATRVTSYLTGRTKKK
jgi:hypothetical protein